MTPAELISRFAADNLRWRQQAVAELVARKEVAALIDASRAPEVVTRVHAIEALGRLRAELPRVLEALGETENHGAVAIAAERALAGWPCVDAVTALALRGPPNVRPRAVRVLKGMDAPVELFVRLMADSLPTVRLQALEAVAALDPAKARLLLPALREDPVDFVREGAGEALEDLG